MSKIDEYWRKLYSRKNKNLEDKNLERIREIRLKKHQKNLKNDWNDYENIDSDDLYRFKKNETNIFTIIFYLSITFFILAVGTAIVVFSLNNNKTLVVNPEIMLESLPSTASGEEYDYKLIINNITDYKIKNLKILIKYQDEVYDYDKEANLFKDEVRIKEILPGETKKIEKRISLFGDTNEKKKIDVTFLYEIEGYSIDFSKKKEILVKIDSSPVFVKIIAPKNVKTNDEFELQIEVSSNVNKDLKNLVLIGRFPLGFKNIEINPNPYYSTPQKNIFKIPELKVGEKKIIKFKTKIVGENNESKTVQFIVGSAIDDIKYELKNKFFETKEKIIIKKPNFGIKFDCSGIKKSKDGYWVTGSETDIDCDIHIKNNLDSKISDLKFGILYNDKGPFYEDSINATDGYVDSNKNIISWDRNTKKDFVTLDAYGEKEVKFKLRTKKIKELAGYVKNPEFKLKFKIVGNNYSSDAVSEDESNGEVSYSFEKDVRLMTDVGLSTAVNYLDSPFENTGGPQPKVGRKITYAIKWQIYNTTNKIEKVKVIGKLPIGVEFEKIFKPENSYIKYNPRTREISWYLKEVEPYIGYRTDPKTLVFKVSYTPVLADAGQMKTLLTNQVLTAVDDFTGEEIKVSEKPVNTKTRDKEGKRDYYSVQR